MDSFIESSSKLLEAYPGASVSITYANMSKKKPGKKAAKDGKTAPQPGSGPARDERRAKNVVKFKVYDSPSSKCLVYSTYKAKELSKILAFLGPRGVASSKKNVTSDPEPKTSSTLNADSKTTSSANSSVTSGVAAVMSNLEFKEPEVTVAEEKPVVEEKKDESKKKKSKKKGRK